MSAETGERPPHPPGEPTQASGVRRAIRAHVWGADDAFRLVAMVMLLTLAERAVLMMPAVASLRGTAQIVVRSLVFAAFYGSLVTLLSAYARRAKVPLAEAVGLRWPTAPGWLLRTLGVALLAVVAEIAFLALLQGLGVELGPPRDVVRFFGETPAGYVAVVLLAVLAGPFVEEMLFRGAVLLGLASWWGDRVGIAIAAVLFGLVHMDARGFVPFVLLGIGCGWLRVREDSLWPAFGAHAAFNAMILGVTLFGRG